LEPKNCDINQKAWKYIYDRVNMLDASSRIALSDGTRRLSYSSLFANVKKYASVFSALGMTEKKKARIGLVGTGAIETITAFYALNMTGAEVSLISSLSVLKAQRIMDVVKDEHLTDLIITDEFIQDNTFRKLLQKKDELGLRFILLLHLPMWGAAVPMPISFMFEKKASNMWAYFGPLYMDYLVNVYGNTPISYAENISSDSAVIIHTSGTTSGSGSPIVMSDKALNAMCEEISSIEGYESDMAKLSTALLVDLSNAYGMIVQVHWPFSLGGKVATVPGNALNPFCYRIIQEEKINALFCTGAVFDIWSKVPGISFADFSSLKAVIIGGTQITVEDKKRFQSFLQAHGLSNVPILNGYGISELGGVCTLSDGNIEDDSIGHFLKGVKWRLFDEDKEVFYSEKDLPNTGVLYLRSEAMSSLYLDGKKIVKSEQIDGEEYICTNDLVSIDENGKITYLGRANRFFLHQDGVKYQSGLVEAELSREKGIKAAAIVPYFDKPIHDTIPMLCVSVSGRRGEEIEIVKEALRDAFITRRILEPENLPLCVLITPQLPRNANGKIDLYRITKGEIDGQKYSVETKRCGKEILEISLALMKEDDENIVSKVYKGIAKDMMDESLVGQAIGGIKNSGLTYMPGNYYNPVCCDNMHFFKNMKWKE